MLVCLLPERCSRVLGSGLLTCSTQQKAQTIYQPVRYVESHPPNETVLMQIRSAQLTQ
jgi:hypothetical protein